MGELTTLLLIMLGIGVVVLVLWIVVLKLEKRKAAGAPAVAESAPPPAPLGPPPYKLCSGILTDGEQAFFPALQQALPLFTAEMKKSQPPLLFAKVRFADLIEPDAAKLGNDRSARQTALNKIDRKHADFVLCDPQSTRPLLVIELDDASHRRPDRIDRDDFIDSACQAARLPIAHIRGAQTYDPATLVRQLAAAMRP